MIGKFYDTIFASCKNTLKNLVENFAIPLSLFGAVALLPQAWEILVLKKIEGVSLPTFALFLGGNIFWLMYGTLHSEKTIIFSNLSTGIINLLIVIGLIWLH